MTAQNSLKMETMFVRCAILSTEKHKLHNEPEMLKQFPCRRAKSLRSCAHICVDLVVVVVAVVNLLFSFII